MRLSDVLRAMNVFGQGGLLPEFRRTSTGNPLLTGQMPVRDGGTATFVAPSTIGRHRAKVSDFPTPVIRLLAFRPTMTIGYPVSDERDPNTRLSSRIL